jgi:uncharacterized protein YbjQ (UPF0145 family)
MHGNDVMVTTTFSVNGYNIEQYGGIVRGIVVRSPTIAQGLFGGLKSLIGGQIGAYKDMCESARQQAFDAMIEHTLDIGANAVIGMRYDATEIGPGITEVLCYGTAVVIKPSST